MHYYKRNIGDYHRKAGRLTMIEHGAYALLMDACYDREIFPTRDQAIEWLWARSKEEIEAVDFVLSKFFEQDEEGRFIQKRIANELGKYHENAETNRRIAQEREERKRTNRVKGSTNRGDVNNEPSRTVANQQPNHKPLTINQEPLNKKTSDPPDGESPSQDPDDVRCAQWMYEKIRNVMPKEKPPNFEKWANTIRLMRERDNYTRKEIATVFSWANNNGFWQTNIRSPEKLRKQFPVLDRQRQDDETGRRNGTGSGRPLTKTERIDRDIDNDFGSAH